MIEVQADAVLTARDLGGIGAPLDDAGDDDGIARSAGLGGDDDPIADTQPGIGGEPTVYRN